MIKSLTRALTTPALLTVFIALLYIGDIGPENMILAYMTIFAIQFAAWHAGLTVLSALMDPEKHSSTNGLRPAFTRILLLLLVIVTLASGVFGVYYFNSQENRQLLLAPWATNVSEGLIGAILAEIVFTILGIVMFIGAAFINLLAKRKE